MSEEKDEHWYSFCPSCGIKTLIPIKNLEQENKELRTRVADWRADAVKHAQEVLELRARLSTLLKASEGMEKALEAIAGRDVSIPDYDWCDWNGLDATHETSKIIAEFAKQALADFRAVKENMEKGAGK